MIVIVAILESQVKVDEVRKVDIFEIFFRFINSLDHYRNRNLKNTQSTIIVASYITCMMFDVFVPNLEARAIYIYESK